jgi:Tol biopolymer transport system component
MTSQICASLFLVSVATGEKRRLTWPPEPSIGDGWPAISPDGQLLAFARYAQDSTANIYLMPPAGGSPRQLTADKSSLFGLTWTADAKQIVLSSNRSGVPRLWRLAVNPSPPSPIAPSLVESAGENARFPSISRPGPHAPARLAYQRFEENLDIRRAELVDAGTRARTLKPSSPFIASTKSEDHPQYAPDGRKIAFVSTRSGTFELWLSDRDGSHVSQLTSMRGPIVVGPRWSPDGRRIAFFATTGASGQYLTYVIDAEGGRPSRLSRDDRELEALPTWSRDGRWIYFASGRSGALQIWKMPLTANGDGEPVQLTRKGGAESAESPDGRFLYYTKVPEVGPGLWSIPIEGGEERRVLDTPRFGYWTVAPTGIYFVDFTIAPEAPRPVKFYDFATRTVTQIGTIEKTVKWSNTPGFAMSPDERWLLYSTLESVDGDLMWVDNFK